MSSAIFSLPEIFAAYKNWVSSNPQLASDFETSAKWISYFIAGRINNSQILSELVYSLSNLLVLFNDEIIRRSSRTQPVGSHERIKIWLTVLNYAEVFLEMSALKVWGERGRWLIIVSVQLLKCVARLVLVFRHEVGMIESPPLPTLQRRTGDAAALSFDVPPSARFDALSFTLERSGKVIRRVDTSPPIAFRTWKPPSKHISKSDGECTVSDNLVQKQLIAETLYVLKPIVHLGSVACFGDNTWKPWLISLSMDLYSLWLYKMVRNVDYQSLTRQQQLQISRRVVVLLLYLLRSPFYENYSRKRLEHLLGCTGKRVPLAGLICNPLLQYLPFWQKTYFYMWST